MRTTRAGFKVVGITAVLALGAAPAQAKGPAPGIQLKVSPAQLLSTAPIRVSFVGDGRLPRGWRYVVLVNGGATGVGVYCALGGTARIQQDVRRGQRVELDIRPQSPSGAWCVGGRTSVVVARVDVDQRVVPVAKQSVRIINDPARPAGNAPPQPVTGRLLEGSSMTVHAPGRPDHVIGLTGLLVGNISGVPRPNTDIEVGTLVGDLSATTLTPDPLCTGPSYVTTYPSRSESFLRLAASGHATLRLLLGASPFALAGCSVPPGGATDIVLDGQVGEGGLRRLVMSGSVANVPVDGGSVVLNLVVNVDLSGKV